MANNDIVELIVYKDEENNIFKTDKRFQIPLIKERLHGRTNSSSNSWRTSTTTV